MKKLKLFSMLLTLVFACTENNEVVKSTAEQNLAIESNSEKMGKMLYDRVNTNALEDPLAGLGEQERQSFTDMFDKLKAKGEVRAEDVLNEQLNDGTITPAIHDAILQYNEQLFELVQQNPDVDITLMWCLTQEDVIKKQDDLTHFERERILIHQALLRNYIQATLEKLPDSEEKTNARVEGLRSILCQVGCAINNITSFSSVGALVGPTGAIIGAGAGLIYTIVGGATACPSCSATPPCQYATSISSPDVCYNSTQGKTFTAWGYGSLPQHFKWDFYNFDNLNVPFFSMQTTTDQYTLTNAQLGGRTRIAVQVRSSCSGSYQYSNFLWFSITDAGQPRPVVLVQDMGNNLVRYTLSGVNNSNPVWSFIPPYRGSLVGGSYSSPTIMIQWVSSNLRVGANVTTTSPCGTASANGY